MVLIGLTSMTSSSASEVIGGGGDTLVDGGGDACVNGGSGSVLLPTPEEDSPPGVDPSRCLVVEDAPAGVRSGNAAGCKTLGLITSHSREQMEEVNPDWLVPNLAR